MSAFDIAIILASIGFTMVLCLVLGYVKGRRDIECQLGEGLIKIKKLESENRLFKREILAANVTVQIDGREWVTVPVVKGEIHNLRSALEKIEPCTECDGLTYVLREFGEIACPECQPDAYADQIRDIGTGY